MSKILTIPKTIGENNDRNYQFLREEGIRHIESLASQIWTDYNVSDPGITILEALCYAITDLGLRMEMPMEDLLASEKDVLKNMHLQFHSALKILPTTPVSPLDYRKLFVNLKGVKNAWMYKVSPEVYVNFAIDEEKEKPQISYKPFEDDKKVKSFRLGGLNQVKIELEDDIRLLPANQRQEAIETIKERVRKIYHKNRNLCEDLVEIKTVDQQEVVVCGEIELMPTANAEEVNAQILFAIQNYLTPAIKFYTLEELIKNKKRDAEEIFKGPLFLQDVLEHDLLIRSLLGQSNLLEFIESNHELITRLSERPDLMDDPASNLEELKKVLYDNILFHGFIDDEELKKAGLRKEIRVSDLIDLIQKIEGVKEVRDLLISLCETNPNNEDDCQCGDLSEASLQWKICVPEGVQPVLCFKGSNFRFFKDLFPINVRKSIVKRHFKELENTQQRDRFNTQIEDIAMPIGQFRKIDNYYSFQNDLPDTYSVGEKGLAPVSEEHRPYRQAQARQLKAYLLFFDQVLASYFAQLSKVKNLLSADETLKRTYFTQVVTSVKELKDIFKGFDTAETQLNDLIGKLDLPGERRHQFLDHLISRFAERFGDYVFMLYDEFDQNVEGLLINQKTKFLNDYPSLSSRRGTAYNYFESADQFWDTSNVSGMQSRIGRIGGFDTINRQNSFGFAYEFYQEIDSDEISEFRWRIRDEQAKIILSSSLHYHEKKEALLELKKAVELAKDSNNFEIKKTEDQDQWFFNIVDENDDVVARRIEFFSSQEEALEAVAHVVAYLSDKSLAIEGMYVIEHILLRPNISQKDAPSEAFYPICADLEKDPCQPLDPYSFRISIILPGWTRRFGDMNYRQFLEQLIRMETPAHIMPKICWIGPQQMQEFESKYKELLELRANNPGSQVANEILEQFIESLEGLRTIYWQGTLHDCIDEGEQEEDNPVILNRTHLGNLQKSDNNANNDEA